MNDVSSTGIYVSYAKQLIQTPAQKRNIIIVLICVYIISLIVTIVKILKTKRKAYDPIHLYYILITISCIMYAIISSYLPYILSNSIQNPSSYTDNIKYIILLYIFMITPIFLRLVSRAYGRRNPKNKILNLLIHPLYYFVWFIIIYIIQNTNLFARIPYVGFLFESMQLKSMENLIFFEINIIVVIFVLLAYIVLIFVTKVSGGQALSILCRREQKTMNGVLRMDEKCFQSISVENMYIPYFVSFGFLFYKFIWSILFDDGQPI